jgi:hypothetical protein
MREFMGGHGDLDQTRDAELLPERLQYLRGVLERADQLPLRPDFDPREVQQEWAQAAAEQAT